MSTRALLDALPALTEALTELTTRRPDLAELCEIAVGSTVSRGTTTGELHIAGSVPPAAVLAWCDAIRADAGRCLPSAGADQVTVTATGQLGDLPVRLLSSLPADLARQLGKEWTPAQLRELTGASTETAGGAR